ncbi:MAG TPA: undecaprenyl-diphosphate phosphatase [Acidimicrobiales bacterium]|nr:undecaprenyl-diphosphate phosphatase [Acidimicrobiales bacterium]
MPLLHAIVLGIVQGLSEFLPISSSGHLILVPWVFGWEELTRAPELNRAFDVALHMGTFVGALVYFRADVARFAAAGLRSLRRRGIEGPDERMAWLLAVSAVPAAVAGAALDAAVGGQLTPEWVIGALLVVFAGILLIADRLPGARPETGFGVRDAVLMGGAQAVALFPGVSRSGVTISMGRWLGFQRDSAARLSFLMSLPVIGGAGIYEATKLLRDGGIPAGFGPAFAWGAVASGVTGFAAVAVLIRYLRTRSFLPFVVYRVALGAAVIALAFSRQ